MTSVVTDEDKDDSNDEKATPPQTTDESSTGQQTAAPSQVKESIEVEGQPERQNGIPGSTRAGRDKTVASDESSQLASLSEEQGESSKVGGEREEEEEEGEKGGEGEGEEGGQTDHLVEDSTRKKDGREGETKKGGEKPGKPVAPPTSVVTPPPKQPRNIKVCILIRCQCSGVRVHV